MYNCYLRADSGQTSPTIVFQIIGDVTGDGIPDKVSLVGTTTPGSLFIDNITLVVQDGRSGKIARVSFKNNAGYNPRIFLGDFNGDGINDILVTIDSGGSGAITYDYVYSFINNVPRLMFDSDTYNETYKYTVAYMDNYKVQVICKNNNQRYIIDISLRGKDYLDEIYDENGKLKQQINGFVNPLSGLYPVDFNSDGVYELLAYQKIAGRYNADSLGYILNVLSWQNNSFILQNQNVAIWGA